MRALALTLAALALAALASAGPAASADREVLFGDPFRLETARPGPFDRLQDGRLVCLSAACAGRTVEVGGVTVRVRSRVTRKEVAAASPSYREPGALPPAGGRSGLSTVLLSAAALSALLAAGLAAARRRRPAAAPAVDRLLRALRLVRESAGRPAADRRRALDHLAATLGDAPPADVATRLAWARPEPDPASTRAVADEVAR
jgi:hypothetical protein